MYDDALLVLLSTEVAAIRQDEDISACAAFCPDFQCFEPLHRKSLQGLPVLDGNNTKQMQTTWNSLHKCCTTVVYLHVADICSKDA